MESQRHHREHQAASFDVRYQQTSLATQDVITFTARPPVTVTGFGSTQVDVYAISDPANVRYLSNPGRVYDSMTARIKVSFDDPHRTSNADERYQVLRTNQYQSPAELVVDQSSFLRTSAHSTDYIVITHPAFITAIQPLVEHRRNEGLRVEVVDVTDIYDEFSDGLQTDQAIKDFLSYAYHNWLVKPAYVLLVGDATINFKILFSDNVPTFVPTHFYRAYDGAMVPTDTWFVTVDGDDPLPDMYIGRLPVTQANVSAVVNKIITYDQPGGDMQWMSKALFIADNDDQNLFESVSDEMAGILAPHYTNSKVYLGQVDQDRFSGDLIADKRNAIKNYLKNGNVITTYTGHGSTALWAAEGLYSADDVDLTTNPDRLTFMIALNCLSSYFVRPSLVTNKLSLAEAFMTSDRGGAIATWAASYLGFTADHQVMATKLFTSIEHQGDQRLGAVTTEALIQALSAGASTDTLDSYLFFGDPATAVSPQRVVSDSGGGGGGILWFVPLLLLGCVPIILFRRRRRP